MSTGPQATGAAYLDRLACIALGLLTEPGNRQLGQLVRQHGPAAAMKLLQRGEVDTRLRDRIAPRLAQPHPFRLAEHALRQAERLGARIVTPVDQEWPMGLDDLIRISRDSRDPIQRDTFPPLCLWVRGPHPLDQALRRSVAVVGARACTHYGEHVAAELSYGLATLGWSVVSGGALGVDAAAHRGALAADGTTVAVLACGVEQPYPASHAALFDRIAERGLLVTEWPPESDPHRRRFLIRNRVIAAITRGTVVVEAGVRSGARYTLHRARDLGRPALVVPGPITSAMSAGCHEELRIEGTLLVANVAHIVEAVGRIGDDLAPVARASESPRDRLDALQRQILDGVRPRKVLTAEQIAAAVGASVRDARRTLPALELAGFVIGEAGGYRLRQAGDPTE
jgi:DNA processing protein